MDGNAPFNDRGYSSRRRAVAITAAIALGALGLTAAPAHAADFTTTTTVTCTAGTAYTGLPQDNCSYTVVGSDSTVLDNGSGGLLTYDDNTNAGTVTATVNYPGDLGTPSYDSSSDTDTFTIGKADATVDVTPYTDITTTYDGSEYTAAVTSIDGVNGESGATVGTVDVTNTAHTDAGTYSTDSWTFTGTSNYNDIGSTTITDSIAKADATVNCTAYDVTYDATEYTPDCTVTGAEEGGGATGVTLDLSDATHTDAGDYSTDTWSLDGGTNYNDIDATQVSDYISPADATITCTPYTVTYDGSEHTASCTAGGVDAEGSAAGTSFDVSGTAHTNVGNYSTDGWTFDGGTNYNDDSGTVADVINTATIGSGTYTGAIAVPAGARFTLSSSFNLPTGCSTSAYTYQFSADGGSTWPWYVGAGSMLRTVYTSDVQVGGLSSGAYDVRAHYEGDSNCSEAYSDAPGFVVYDASTAAYGGGQYVNNGRANFGFEYHAATRTRAAGGNVVWNWKGQWRFKGKLSAYGKKTSGTLGGKTCTSTNPCGALSGSGSLFYFNGTSWVSVGNNIVVNVSAIQTTPTSKNTSPGWIGFVFGYTPSAGQPALPSNSLISLQKSNNGGGGVIALK